MKVQQSLARSAASLLVLPFLGCGAVSSETATGTGLKQILGDSVEEIVYDNTTALAGNSLQDILPTTKIGDVVTLSGTARCLTQAKFLIGAHSEFREPVIADIRLVLYQKGLRFLRPGRAIYRSPFKTVDLQLVGMTSVVFSLPSVEVPDTLVWSLEFRGFEPYLEYPKVPFATPATIGDDNPRGRGFWYYNVLARRWFFLDIAGTSFYCQLWASDSELDLGHRQETGDQVRIQSLGPDSE